tara:strand:+ start:901 stop:1416 length:516 start_codon:yes stop_codon:yes gene_type:complete
MKIEIVDNFCMEYYVKILEKTFDGSHDGQGGFPWFYKNDLNDKSAPGNFYLTNLVIMDYKMINGTWISLFIPLLDQLKIPISNVCRLKVNFYPRTQRRVHHQSHTDYKPNSGLTTALYYLNENNGVTIFDGKKTVKSKRNRVAFFDGSIKHHSTTPTDCNHRVTINVDYKL